MLQQQPSVQNLQFSDETNSYKKSPISEQDIQLIIGFDELGAK